MSTISSRDEALTIKVAPNSKYKPLQMTDESVYDMARHWYTCEEIAQTFNVTPQTLLKLHGDAFRNGKANGMQKPRMLLDNILQGFASYTPEQLTRSDVPTHNLLKAIELHAKKYEGLGSKQTIVHEGGLSYDKVESKPIILERPDEAE
jgi:hypothetical protein